MASYKIPFTSRARYRFGLASLLLITVVCAAFSFTGNEDFNLARREILLRKIGHEILLQSGDSTSRVLPVEKVTANDYHIRFENEFTFEPDSLVKIISRALEDEKLSGDYIVNVVSCSGQEAIFGYAISRKEQNNIVPCSGRKQPRGCYLIDLIFKNPGITGLRNGYLIGGVSLFAFMGLLMAAPFRIRKSRKETSQGENDAFLVGNTLFDANKRQITTLGITTELTPKENKLFRIFAHSPNVVIERSRIQKEIWEDEGVIVGRSLDVFISKLRKKLENDPSIQLINIHGRGYKLETGDPSIPDCRN